MSPPAEAVKFTLKVSVISLPVAAVVAVGGPLAAALAGSLGTLSLALCWVLNDHRRTGRLVKLIQAMRATATAPRSPSVHRAPRLTPYGRIRRPAPTTTAFPWGTMELEVTVAEKTEQRAKKRHG